MAYETLLNGPLENRIDLIGEEFSPRCAESLLVSAYSNIGSVVTSHATGTSTIFTTTGIPVSVVSAASMAPISTVIVSTSDGSIPSIVDPNHHHHHHHHQTSVPLSTVTVDLPSVPASGHGTVATDENGGVLLCNIDELSRYIPENFYADLNFTDASTLEATTVASAASTPIHSTHATAKFSSTPIISLSNGTILQATSPMTSLPLSITQPLNITQGMASLSAGHHHQMNLPTVIQLPTQPQPPQAVKSMAYLQTSRHQHTIPINTASLQPVKLTPTGYALTSSGERITIHGLDPSTLNKGHPLQIQLKHGGIPQTIQLNGLNIDTSKLTVLQELPENSKVVIHEPNKIHNDSISNILEEMRTDDSHSNLLQQAGMELATAIPVAVTNLHSKDQQKSFKLKGPPSTIVLPPNKKGTRNIIFAGNNLPPGAIPIQINGLNQISGLPMSAVKSIPMPLNLNSLTQSHAPVLTQTHTHTSPQVVAAKKSKVDPMTLNRAMTTNNANLVNAAKMNNNTAKAGGSKGGSMTGGGPNPGARQVGNNKTCTWLFENGETCGKTFSKSYNLVVHMRMHEDVRPFQCSMCDQTFRQKAHLQRHETTHGIGSKGSRSGGASPRKRRKSRGSVGNSQGTLETSNTLSGSQLQARLAHVDSQFGKKSDEDYMDTDTTTQAIIAGVKRKYSNSAELEEAIRTVINDDGQDTITEIIELKDGTATLLTGDGNQRIRRIAVKIDEHGRSIITPLDDDDDSTGGIMGETFTIQNDLRDEDIIENVSMGDTVVTAATPIMVTSVQDAVNHGIVQTMAGNHVVDDKQIVMNFSDHNPALQRDILNAMLAEESAGGLGNGNHTMVVVTSSGEVQGTISLKQVVEHHQAQEEQCSSAPGTATGSPHSNDNVQVESQPEFSPVNVQEFTENSAE
eukprot:maker-scaffold733_size105121-snap-gene-0.19 protein:Tk04997 transcript:maker-scaffold733_size105121-snap-gene-0.19-mRNA-1 annotation:"hypothetical protein KGM_19023"